MKIDEFNIGLDIALMDIKEDGQIEFLSADEVQRSLEARCIAELPLEIYVPQSVDGYKGNPPLYNGIYKLGLEVVDKDKVIISYYRRYIEMKEVVFSLEISRNNKSFPKDIKDFLNYLESNNIEVFNTEGFVKLFANFVRNNLEPDTNVHGEKIAITGH